MNLSVIFLIPAQSGYLYDALISQIAMTLGSFCLGVLLTSVILNKCALPQKTDKHEKIQAQQKHIWGFSQLLHISQLHLYKLI